MVNNPEKKGTPRYGHVTTGSLGGGGLEKKRGWGRG